MDTMIKEYLDEQFEEFPERASSLGLDGYDDRLGDYSEEAVRRRHERTDHWHSKFSAVGDDGITLDEQIDRDLAITSLRGLQVMRDWESWRKDPAVYLGPGLGGVFTLFLNRLRPDPELAESAIRRMNGVPRVLEQGKANLDSALAAPLIVQRAIGQCAAGVSYFRNIVATMVDDPADRERLSAAGEIAAKAHEDFGTFLEKLHADSEGSWAIGDTRYSGLLKEKERLGYGAEEMLEKGREAYAELDAEMKKLARDLRGSDNWREVLEELTDDHPATPEEMKQEYTEWTERARQFLIDKDLVTLPDGEECVVEPSPHFQRPILAVASYSSPPAFKPGKKGHFFVPYPPEGTSEEEIQKRLKSNSRVSIPTTSVHEAYPGHHWHLVKTMDNPRPLRKVIWTSYFVEGWALYAERMMREEGLYTDPVHEMGQLEARIFRAARIIVDTSLHLGKMSHDEAIEFMHTKTALTEVTARAEVGRYCSWPTQAPSYLTGSLEIERMRKAYLQKGKGGLKEFHDTIATSGGLPIGLVERLL